MPLWGNVWVALQTPVDGRPLTSSPLLQMRSWPEPVYVAHPVAKALYSLFARLGAAFVTGSPGAVNPLRGLNAGDLEEALAALPGQLLPAGEEGR